MNLETLYKFFYDHPEGEWVAKPGTVKHLHKFLKENDIKTVLDLGTGIGCSAAIIAYTLQEKGVDYQIDTVEQNKKCYDLAQELIPKEFKKNINFHLSEAIAWQNKDIPYQHFSNFKELPKGDYDLILVDGPGGLMVGDKYIELPNGDIMKMSIDGKLKAGTFIAWDKRIAALRMLEKYYGDNFYLVLSSGENGFLNVLERKEGEAFFENGMLEVMKERGYFGDYKAKVVDKE